MNSDRKTLPPAGLPPLPKSLSVVTSAEITSSPSAMKSNLLNHHHQSHMAADSSDLYLGPSTSAAATSRQQESSLSDRESVHSRASVSSHHSQGKYTTNNDASNNSTCTLDAQIAILRREMYGLRQLDLSLLSQLWALHESIQGFRIFLESSQDLPFSPPSPSPTASETNSIESEPEDESELSTTQQPKLSAPSIPTTSLVARGSTASSSSASASGSSSAPSSKQAPTPIRLQKQHPQLPRILQQRAQRAPPPPPPTRLKQLPKKTQVEQQRPA